MKLRDYTASKAVTLCFLGAGVMLLTIFLTAGGAAAPLVAMAAGCCVLLVSGWLVCGYLTERARLNRLERLINGLDEPYLLGELLPAPVNPVERYYYAAMKTVSRSAVGIAEAALREKEEYCAYVESWIHEIKTPLTACSLILANNADPRKLKRELKRADNLTETILYYARLRTAEKDMQVREIHAAHIMDDAVKSQMELLIAAGVSVSLTGDFTVSTDAKPLCFILKQLLINCAKYCPGCRIVMRAENGTISVCDNGIGIPAHELGRVTERGFTGTNGKRSAGSTGMGLYIVRELCTRLGIALSIESEPGKFTRVTLRFENLTNLENLTKM